MPKTAAKSNHASPRSSARPDAPARFHQSVAFLPTRQIMPVALLSEELGYGGIYVSDHVFNPRSRESRYTYSKREDGHPGWEDETAWPDPMCVISGLATVTEHLTFTTGVYIAPARDLITVAKTVGTAAALSGDRVRLGVGVGWCKEEFEQTGQEFTTRGKRLDEMIVALRALWRPGYVEFHGDYYDVPECQMEPSPSAPVPIIGGGHSPVALRRTAALCDGWIAAGAYSEEEAWEHLGDLREALEKAGRRTDGDFAIYLSINERPSVDLYGRFIDAGVTDFVCAPWMGVHVTPDMPEEQALATRLDAVRWFADEIVSTSCSEQSKESGDGAMKAMKVGLQLGYWGSGPPAHAAKLVEEADRLGYDSVWTAESYGSDALTPLAWWGSQTEKVRLGTSLCQLSARTPTAMAMAAQTIDHLSGGRFVLGLGVSGPQVVEGWYGQPFPQPLARTREYVDIVRQVLARDDVVTNDGKHYPLPYPGGTNLGKPLKSIVHPRRPDIPIILGAEGPKNIALAAEIADGWFPIFFSPRAMSAFEASLDEGHARPGARRSADDFEVLAMAPTVISDDVDAAADGFRPSLALYIGGMGAKEMNFHFDVFARMGYGEAATKIQDAYLDGRKDDAAAAVPTSLVEEISLIGPAEKIRDDLEAWRESRATTLLVSGDVPTLRTMAELVLRQDGSGRRPDVDLSTLATGPSTAWAQGLGCPT